jgi:hypothetical protein
MPGVVAEVLLMVIRPREQEVLVEVEAAPVIPRQAVMVLRIPVVVVELEEQEAVPVVHLVVRVVRASWC